MLSLRALATGMFDKVGTKLLSPPSRAFGYFTNHGPRNKRQVALTFDDGPSRPCTAELLDTLGELQVPATFFCLGVNAQFHPDLLWRIYEEGHLVGNHSSQHSRKTGLQLGNDIRHIKDAERTISNILKVRPKFYRPPWGWLTPWEGKRLKQAGYQVIGWDVYTLDWQLPEVSAQRLADDAYRDTRPGSIICFHDAKPWEHIWYKSETNKAVRLLVPRLRAEGYEFVTVAQMLGTTPYRPLAN